ncbi:protein phosphatase 1 regulatory subunit 12A-like isoform X2 [Paramacrobiotus metropolitanus]|uniref:protein phosphatase 1 regulatory subunit 12A-like isoform X2 n=1 Tax=Paramacrobiotus metropolitanus TaxID=2943436 RepID=UPI002445FC63|nr:protein phosphatase 1 regulatory subunit 12A-like isoform X2 [Paramacrobiotus metropolitanus]
MAPADENNTSLSDLPRSSTAIQKRSEQLKRWTESETNKELSDYKEKKRKVAFQDDCVFLAACAAGERDEVLRMLTRGSDINTANVDGLTALHQACIDDRIDMVIFLVEHGADINRGDNEGWTPLHATASCGYLNIAKFLIEHGARVDIVNNDGELPIDIADTDEMESLLQAEVHRQGIDADLARSEEEQIMLKDVKEWYGANSAKENIHPKTGATPLHVAAAKGYREVMRLLLDLGVDIDARDVDGWTPLHAAAHWGHREGCRMLVEYGCDMEARANMGQLASDLCENDMVAFLEDLQKRQSAMAKEKYAQMELTNRPIPAALRKRVTGVDKAPLQSKDVPSEKTQLESLRIKPKDNSRICDTENVQRDIAPKPETPTASPYQANSRYIQSTITPNKFEKELKITEPVKPISFLNVIQEKPPPEPKPAVSVPVPAPVTVKPISFPVPEDIKPISFLQSRESQFPLTAKLSTASEKLKTEPPPLVQPLQKVTPISFLKPTDVAPSASSPQKPVAAVVSQPPVGQTAQKGLSSPATGQNTNKPSLPQLSSFEYIDDGPSVNSPGPASPAAAPQRERPSRRNTDWPPKLSTTTDFPNYKAPLTHTQPMPSPVKKASSESKPSIEITTVSASGSKAGISSPSPGFFAGNVGDTEVSSTATVRRSFQAPSRDEESEAQRKAHAKRVRETRRSTQGVSAEDLKAADAQAKQQQADDNYAKARETTSRNEEKENDARRSSVLKLLTIPGASGGTEIESPKKLIPASPEAIITLPLRKTKTDEDMDDQKNSRRRRPKRRSTGVVNIDMEEEEGSASGTDITDLNSKTDSGLPNGRPPHESNGSQGTATGTDRSYTRSKYESSTPEKSPAPVPSYRSSRASSISSLTSEKDVESTNQDWKKMYEQEKLENEKLRKKLTDVEKELSDVKTDTLKHSNVNRPNALSETEKRERRAMERKIAEMEEELKELETLRADNQRLKEENGALIRVISKLSK